jgi:membrane-associated phospholipid phosphatase
MNRNVHFWLSTVLSFGLSQRLALAEPVPSAHGGIPIPSIPDSERYNPRYTDGQLIAPSAPNWKQFGPGKVDFRAFILPPPPANTSEQTALEIQELVQLAATRNDPNVRASIRRWNDDPPTLEYHRYFGFLMQTWRGYFPPIAARCEALLSDSIYTGMLAAWNNKWMYLRPRPDQMTGYTFRPDPEMQTPAHPSYPSGHATSAGAFLAVGMYCFPEHDPNIFLSLMREASLARRQGGVHFYSDTQAGEALGFAVANEVIAVYDQDGSPRSAKPSPAVYSRLPTKDYRSTPVTTIKVRPVTVKMHPELVQLANGKKKLDLIPLEPFIPPPPMQNPPAAIVDIPPTP